MSLAIPAEERQNNLANIRQNRARQKSLLALKRGMT